MEVYGYSHEFTTTYVYGGVEHTDDWITKE